MTREKRDRFAVPLTVHVLNYVLPVHCAGPSLIWQLS